MVLIIPRQRAYTALRSGSCNVLIPKRHKLGPRIYLAEGEDHTVTLTGPSQSASVTFPTDPGKSYKVHSAIIAISDGVVSPTPGDITTFETFKGTVVQPPGTKQKDDMGNPTVYGFTLTSARTTTGGSSLKLHMLTAAEADPAFSVTHGHFYIREILA